MSDPSAALVERARAHLAASAAPLSPHAVAEALRGAGPVGHDTVLAVHARLVRDVDPATVPDEGRKHRRKSAET